MTENISVLNDEAIYPIEDVLENVLARYGADIIPLSSLKFDWPRINKIIISGLRKFEQWVPKLRWYDGPPNVRSFTMPDDCQDIRAVMLNVQGIIETDMQPLYPNVDYTYNKDTNIFNAYLTNVHIQYLGTYLLVDNTITTDEEYVVANVKTTFKINYVPDPRDISIIMGEIVEQLIPTNLSPECQSYSFSGGTVNIDLSTMEATVLNSTNSEIQLTYKTKYKAISGITEGEEFFEALVAERLLTSIGNMKAVVNFNSMPVNITADNLASLGQSIHSEVEGYCQSRKKWWRGITAIS